MITIKDTLGNVRFSTEINTGSRRKFSLMSEDYIVLKFSVEDPVYFKLGDYTDTELGLFELVDLYKPTLNDSTGAYDYELRLDAHYYKWKNKIFKFNPEVGGSEAGWKLTATLDVHLGVFLRNLSALGYTYKGTPFEVNIDSTVAKTSKLIVYDNTNLIDALTQMAETWECEWWVEDNQIRFGRCEFGDPVDFVINENVERMPREESKATFATRVYAFGSTRNIPNDYRPVDESVVVNGIVQKRLMMPTGVPYVDAYPDMTTEEAVEDVVIFDDIYPRRTGTMSSVTPVERTENVENEDGSTTQQKYTVYQFKDTGITFSKDYILPGEELRIVFQTGAMAGMDFAVTFNPDNLPEKLEDGSWNPQAQLWEIVRNEDYGRMLPADTLIPTNGDTYNLYGFDSTSPVFEDMIKRAEEELEEKARDYVEKTKIDPNTYPCTMMSDYMYNDGNVRTNEFTVGARINLINPAYFENGRVSRVIGFEFDLDVPYSSPTFTIGETASYSRIGEIEDKVDELTYKGQVFTGTGSGVYVIGTNDNTPPTNKNVYSALKILREFVRYQGWVDQPVRKSDPVKFNSVTSPLFIFNELTTPKFVSGLLGAGTRLKDNHLELDEITVRKRMNVFELLIQRVRAVGGQLLLSPASIKISTVEELENGYKCSFNTDDQTIPEPFVLNDQAFHQTFTGKGINRYWRLTTEAGDDYFVLSKTDCEPGSGIPQPGDEVILLGNRTDKARQSAMMLSAYGNDAPYLDTYDGINDYNLSGKLLTREGNLTGIVDEVFGQLSGSGFYGKNVYLRGKFALSSGVSVEDKFGQTDSQMNNLQGQLTNQQGQLNTQQGQITNIQTDILAIPGQIKQEVSQTVTYEVGNLQIGMVNLLKGSNVELMDQANYIGNYQYDAKPESGKTYTLTICYTLGENNTQIGAFQSGGNGAFGLFTKRGNKVVESFTREWNQANPAYMGFLQYPIGTYGSKVHWAVLVEGNKGPNAWIPSLSEQGETAAKDAVDNLQIGSVNLVSRKILLDMNNTANGSAIWGQDSDGIYISVAPKNNTTLYSNFKNGTQYVISVNCKGNPSGGSLWRPYLNVEYTDGTMESAWLTKDSVYNRHDYISKQGKTIARVYWNVTNGGQTYSNFIYDLAVYEGNKVLSEPPVATEDLTGQSNVNLLDNSKFQFGTEGYFPNQQVTLNVVDGVLQVRSSKTSSTPGVQFPVVHLHPGVYTIKMRAKGINISSCHCYVYKDGTSDRVGVDGISISPVFSGISFTFAVSIEHDYKIYWMWSASTAASYPAGIDIEYSMLTAGEIASQGWSPSPGDVAKDIKDVSDAVSNLDTTINTTFKDGIISEAEAKAIASNINVLNAEKADIDAYYTKLYANAYLTGTAKTNLASAKTAYNTAHTNLINSINTAIADGKATATEKADVDAKFSAYNNALSAYQTRVGEADKAIQDTIKKVADNAQTSANTAQSAANAAQSTANQAQADANAANSKLTTWASDNYISPQEKTALRQQKSDIQSEQKDIEANANRYVISLASYMAAYDAAIDALNKYTATSPENIAVSSDYNNISAYYTARQTILNSIAAAAKAQADKATGAIGMDGGKMLYADPEFKKGLNGIVGYGAQNNGNNGNGSVVLNRISKSTGNTSSNSFTADVAAHVKEEASGSPFNGSDWCLYIKAYGGTTTSHLGGFMFGNKSRANAVFIVKVSAKIPVGYTLKNAHNAHGTGSKQELLTSMAGTGKYETYIFKETCGSTGTFSTMNHLYLSGPVKPGNDPLDPDNAPLEWFVDYATVFDLTADGYGDIVEIAKTETVAGINNNPDSVTVYAKKTDFNSLNQVVNQQGSQLQVNTSSIDAIVTKNGSGTIVSIKPEMVEITGATVIKDGNGNKVNIFGVGDKVISVNGGVFSVDKVGKVIMTNAEITGKITSTSGEIGGMLITNNGIRSTDFNPNTLVGSCYAKNGLSVYASGSGILIPSSGLLQASRITAIGTNASITGMEIVAHNNSGYGAQSEVTALKLSAINDYSTPSKKPLAIDVESGDVVVRNGYIAGRYTPLSCLLTGSQDRWLPIDETMVFTNNTKNINIYLPWVDNATPNGYSVWFIPCGRSANVVIHTQDDTDILNYDRVTKAYAVLTNTDIGAIAVYSKNYKGWIINTLGASGISFG